jgi:hypothetical protein
MDNFDFSKLSAVELQKHKITHAEILSSFNNSNTIWYPIEGYPLNQYYYFFIGFSDKFRFLLVALNLANEKFVFHQVKIAHEEEIQELYCKGRFSQLSKKY